MVRCVFPLSFFISIFFFACYDIYIVTFIVISSFLQYAKNVHLSTDRVYSTAMTLTRLFSFFSFTFSHYIVDSLSYADIIQSPDSVRTYDPAIKTPLKGYKPHIINPESTFILYVVTP